MPLGPRSKARSWRRASSAFAYAGRQPKHGAPGTQPPRPRGLPIEIVNATEVITMNDSPSHAFRRKKESSLHVAARLVRDGKADALVSAGNTGAVMTVARFVIGTLAFGGSPGAGRGVPEHEGKSFHHAGRGRERRLQARTARAVRGDGRDLLPRDLGQRNVRAWRCFPSAKKKPRATNSRAKPQPRWKQCAQFRRQRRRPRRVSRQRRRDRLRRFYRQHRAEAQRGRGRADRRYAEEGHQEQPAVPRSAMCFPSAPSTVCARAPITSEYGGAPLLGVRGITIIGHGRSNANAIKNAIRVATELCRARVNEKIEQELSATARRCARLKSRNCKPS